MQVLGCIQTEQAHPGTRQHVKRAYPVSSSDDDELSEDEDVLTDLTLITNKISVHCHVEDNYRSRVVSGVLQWNG